MLMSIFSFMVEDTAVSRLEKSLVLMGSAVVLAIPVVIGSINTPVPSGALCVCNS